MKRFLLVILAAFAGAVGLPVVMVTCEAVAPHLFPAFVGAYRLSFGVFAKTNGGHHSLLAGFILGLFTIILWRGQRTFWPRLGIVLSALILGCWPIYMMAGEYEMMGATWNPPYLQEVAFIFPWPLWALGLFFFAILARPRRAPSTLP